MSIEAPKTADEFFEKQTEWFFVESEMEELLMDWFDLPDEDDYWWADDFSFDYYDHSFELYNVDPKWEPKEEQLKKAFDFGFSRCWFNYKDGHELYCSGRDGEVHIGERRQKRNTLI